MDDVQREFVNQLRIMDESSRQLYVTNLSWEMNDIREFFTGFTIVNMMLIQQDGGRFCCFAIVTLDSHQERERAIRELNEKKFMGRRLFVSRERPQRLPGTTVEEEIKQHIMEVGYFARDAVNYCYGMKNTLTGMIGMGSAQSTSSENANFGKCGICLDNFAAENMAILRTCKHTFHRACIEEALRVRKVCPNCRREADAIDMISPFVDPPEQ